MKTQMKEQFLITRFWKTENPLLSEKYNARERISMSENGEFVKTENWTVEVFKIFLVIL